LGSSFVFCLCEQVVDLFLVHAVGLAIIYSREGALTHLFEESVAVKSMLLVVLWSLLTVEHFYHVAKLGQFVSALLAMIIIPNLCLSTAQPFLVLEIIKLPTKSNFGQRICDILVVVTSRPDLSDLF
jgi:hypothetical protein